MNIIFPQLPRKKEEKDEVTQGVMGANCFNIKMSGNFLQRKSNYAYIFIDKGSTIFFS